MVEPDTPCNILYVFLSQNYSGAEIVTKRLLLENRYRALPFIICTPGDFAETLRKEGVDVFEESCLTSLEREKHGGALFRLPFSLLKKFFKINFKVLLLIYRKKIRVVHSTNLAASFYLLPLVLIFRLFKSRVRWVWSNHDMHYIHGKRDRVYAASCHFFYHRTLAVSQAVKRQYPKYQQKITVLYNGLNLKAFSYTQEARRLFREEYHFESSEKVIGIVGVICEGKGQLLLLNAFQKLIIQDPQLKVRLVIVGRFSDKEPKYREKLEKKMGGFNSERVLYLGVQREMQKVYSGIDLLVNASSAQLSESLGTTIYEAMACERLVLASSTGGTPEIIEDQKDGFLFQPGNVDDLVGKLSHILSSWNQLEQVRAQARVKVEERFNLSKTVSKYNEIIKNLCGRSGL